MAKEYIGREALLESIQAAEDNGGMGSVVAGTLKRYVKRVPTADVVEVVRCKDCYWSKKHRKLFGEDVCDCAKWPSNDAHRVKAFDDYCSDAYRRSEYNN